MIDNELPDDLNPEYMLQCTDAALLTKIASAEIDVKQLATDELEARGLDPLTGKFKGFGK